ncbi:MAG TPA: hypothetical protein VJ793_02255 [Anaerolineae bacterium]|nr:hypothetical protein [Anaerolineae bacterium]
MKLPILLFCVALGVRLAALVVWPFDGLYGQDAYDYYHYAVSLRESLAQGGGVPPFFWPIGYPLHIVAGQLVVGMQPSAGQAVSVVAGALVAPLTHALAHEALRSTDPRRARRAGLVAGLVVAVAGQMLISSISIMSDAAGLAWATLSAWLVVRYARTLRPPTLALASLTLSLAVITRWLFGLLALPWVASVLLSWRQNWRSIGWRRGIALGLMVCTIGGLIVGTQLLGGDSHTGDLQVVGWNPANAFRREVVNTDGTWRYALPIGLFYLQPLVVPSYVFPLLVPLWLVGLAALGRSDAPPRALLIGWPLVVYVFLAGIAWQNPRFALALFPPLAVWVGVGFDRVWESRPAWRKGLVGLAAIALVGTLAWSGRVVGNFVHAKDADLARVERVSSRLPGGSRVITFGVSLSLDHYTDLEVIDLYSESPESLSDRLSDCVSAFVYVDVENLERQWRGLSPEVNFRWLREEAGLEEVDRFQGYTLYSVTRNGEPYP